MMAIDDTGVFTCTKEVQDSPVVAVLHLFLAVTGQKYQIMIDELSNLTTQL